MEAAFYTVINRDDLPRDDDVFEFEGLRFSDTEVSFIWVDMPPGGTIRLRRLNHHGCACRTDHSRACGCAA